MAMTTSGPINRAIVKKLRASSSLASALTGGIHRRLAPSKIAYPFLVYRRVAAPYARDWDQVEIRALYDVVIFAENSVEAENLDALVTTALNEAELQVDGQTTLLCQRVADLEGPDQTDDEGRRIYQIGGSYSIWTTQPR